MLREYKNTIIISAVGVIFALILVMLTLVDLNFGTVKFSSIKTIMTKYEKVQIAESELEKTQKTYETTLASLETQKSKFQTEKNKYESISDETISIIKEATAKENYSIEYMWIRLGNYAKTNNLSIVLVEPGGSKSSTTTSTTTSQVTSGSNVQSANKNEESLGTQTSSTNETLKIQVTGSYMNISDFIFQVENDAELKFRLDNISIDYVSGTTIKATFDVKNMIINK